jgi:RES domain-containing protein
MSCTAWRLVSGAYVQQAFDGEGSYRFGNRWNHAGVRIVYLAEHLSLAALEVLVHVQEVQLVAYYAIQVEFESQHVQDLAETLSQNWQENPAPKSTKDIGTAWAMDTNSKLLLRVPSAVVPQEFNYLLQVNHSDYNKLKIRPAQLFRFDGRLF